MAKDEEKFTHGKDLEGALRSTRSVGDMLDQLKEINAQPAEDMIATTLSELQSERSELDIQIEGSEAELEQLGKLQRELETTISRAKAHRDQLMLKRTGVNSQIQSIEKGRHD